MAARSAKIDQKADLIWAIADKLTGVYKPHEYGEVILPLTVIRRFDCILSDTKDAELKILTFLGAIGNICGYYANGGTEDCEKIFRYMVMYMSMLLGMPVLDLEKTVKRLIEIVEVSGMAIMKNQTE